MLVSVVIPALAWDSRLAATVDSILSQDLPSGVKVEVVIALADVAGVPGTAGIATVHNPSGTIPHGLNAAISKSTGEVVVRVDSRCLVQPDHVSRVVRGLQDPSVGCVGGAALVLDRGWFGSVYAVAFNSILLGPTVYRYRRRSGPVDTAYLGAWRRRDLERFGGFDPRMIRNQDNELADRVRAAGMTVWFDGDLVVGYYNDRSLAGAVRHHNSFGRWRMVQRSQGQRSLTPRHVAAMGAAGLGVIAGLAGLANQRTRRPMVLTGLTAYGCAAAVAGTTSRRLLKGRRDLDVSPPSLAGAVFAPALAAVLDGAWLAGVVAGMRQGRDGEVPNGSDEVMGTIGNGDQGESSR